MTDVQRLAAFTTNPSGGNPAGVWIGDTELPDEAFMQETARVVGYSETAFLAPADDGGWTVRYFAPETEVPFCGHATIASGVALGEQFGSGTYLLQTNAGDVPVEVSVGDGVAKATLTSVEPDTKPADNETVQAVLDTMAWSCADLDPDLPVGLGYAGAWHLILAVGSRETLARLEYDFQRLRSVMETNDLTTIQVVFREDNTTFHSRNPFPVGGVVEDPATGAAAAALGGYLRERRLVDTPAQIVIHQGDDMGRPSELTVTIPESGGISVSGSAVPIE